MPTEIKTEQWYSGDWKKVPSKQPPFNGIKITGLPTYENGVLVSVKVTFTDYTLNLSGCESTIPELTAANGQFNIPTPTENTSPPSSPPQPNPDFTIQGWVALEHNNLDLSLRIRLSFGLEHARRQELGYIMGFALAVPE